MILGGYPKNAVVPENVLDRSDASCGRREHDPQDIFKDLAERFLQERSFFRGKRIQEKSVFGRRTSSEDKPHREKSILRRRTSSRRRASSGEELLQRKRFFKGGLVQESAERIGSLA